MSLTVRENHHSSPNLFLKTLLFWSLDRHEWGLIFFIFSATGHFSFLQIVNFTTFTDSLPTRIQKHEKSILRNADLHALFSHLFFPARSLAARVKYTMDINMDVNTNRFTGKQKLEYTNNSPDTLYKLFYHLYWNAFQPNSMMDMRSRELGKIKVNGRPDWDGRVRDRISKLKPDEIGYQKVISLKMNGVNQTYKVHETILEVNLSKPILPKSKVTLEMEFEAQVPLQVRRSGRDNPNTGVRYSMSQWYPKLCEYDYEGWHPTPYVAREFYGVWGDYDVNITIDKNIYIGGQAI